VIVSKREIEQLSADIRKIIDGRSVEIRDNREGALSALKNDIHTLADQKNEQIDAMQRERDALKDTLADISHQIKTPLTSMSIMADLLENASPEKQAEFIANIRLSLNRTQWLVDALLKMAKLEAGSIEFSLAPVQGDELVSIALEPLQILLEIKEQQVEVSGAAQIICDKRWTAEALTNILKNASEYSPAGRTIKVAMGENPISAWVAVTDSGSGIAKSEISSLFKRFQGTRSESGYGIGLPLALAILRSQNGDIEVDGGSAESGATFTLKFFKG
jgi:signal transduction histidine kinase